MLGKRILAFAIDYMSVMIFFSVLSFVPVKNLNRSLLISYTFFIIFGEVYFIIKDIFGRSLGKRIMGIKIVRVDGRKPSIIRLILRNITISIWPVEIVLLLLGKEKLGDRLAKTRLDFVR